MPLCGTILLSRNLVLRVQHFPIASSRLSPRFAWVGFLDTHSFWEQSSAPWTVPSTHFARSTTSGRIGRWVLLLMWELSSPKTRTPVYGAISGPSRACYPFGAGTFPSKKGNSAVRGRFRGKIRHVPLLHGNQVSRRAGTLSKSYIAFIDRLRRSPNFDPTGAALTGVTFVGLADPRSGSNLQSAHAAATLEAAAGLDIANRVTSLEQS